MKNKHIRAVCGFVLFAILQIGNAQNTNNFTWLKNQIKQHPEIQAAQAQWQSSLFQAKDLSQPLYNPTLESEYEREGNTSNYLIGVSQTIDRNNKRASNQGIANAQRQNATYNYEALFLKKMSQALQAIIHYQGINKQAKLLLQQEKQLENLLKLVEKRTQSGDLGQLDAQLAYLSLSQGFGQSAVIEAELKRGQAQLNELLISWNNKELDKFIQLNYQFKKRDLVNEHPLVKAAYANWQQAMSQSELAQKNKKNDPSFGISAGKVDNDNLLSLSFSIPLNLRRNFDSAYLAANQQMFAAESEYLAVIRKQKYAIQASHNALIAIEKRYKKWHKLIQSQDENLAELLQKQWQLGDINTTNYLLTLQQRTQGLLAGIELEQNYKAAIINYLTDTAQLGINNTFEVSK